MRDGDGGSGRRGEAATADRGVSAAGEGGPAATLAGDDVVRAEPGRGTDERFAVEPSAAVATQNTARAADAAPTPAISGRVVDPQGNPIAGATVLASDREGFPLDYVTTGGLPPFVTRSVAQTQADGTFALDGVEPPSLRLKVRAPGYVAHEDGRVALPDVPAYALPDVVLQPAGILEGHVVDPFGRGVAGAELYLEDVDGFRFRGFFSGGVEQRPEAITDANGRFRIDELALGAWRVRVETEDHPERSFEGLAERAGIVITRTFELEHGDTIAGSVTAVPDTERDGLIVRATPSGGDTFFGFGVGAREGKVAKDGTFVVKGLRPEAAYELQVQTAEVPGRRMFSSWNSRTRSERVPAHAGQQNLVISYRPEAAVLLQAVDAETGAPVEEFQVEHGFRWRAPLVSEDGRPLSRHPDGRVRIGDLRPDQETAELGISIAAVGYEVWDRGDVRVVASQVTDLGVVELRPLPMVHVTVLDARTGAPVEGARVTLEEDAEPEGGFGRGFRTRSISVEIDDSTGRPVPAMDPGRSALTDAEGRAHLNSLEGKTAKLRVTRDGYAPALMDGIELPVGSAVEQMVKLGRGGSVLVRVLDESGAPLAGVGVDHRAPSRDEGFFMPFAGGREDAVSDLDGHVRFSNLEVGEHRFQLRRPGGGRRGFGGMMVVMDGADPADDGWKRVEVAEGTEASLVLVQPTLARLEGRITEVGVELAGATVRVNQRRDGGGNGVDFGRMMGGGGGGERTDSSGRYRLEDIEPGEYTLSVSHPTRRMPMTFELEIKAGDNRYDADLPVSVIEGRITDQDGRPLAGVEVTAREAGSSAGGRRGSMIIRTVGGPGGSGGGEVSFGEDLGAETHTDADGYYSLRGVATDVELTVRASGQGVQPGTSRAVEVGPNDILKNVDLQLEAAGTVVVEAFQADGTKAEFVMVRASYLDDASEGSPSGGAAPKTAFLQNGEVRLTGMRPGKWKVSLNALGPDGSSAPEPQEVTLAVGVEPRLTFHMP